YPDLIEFNQLAEANFELVDYDGTLADVESEVLAGNFVGALYIQQDPNNYFIANYYTDQLINQTIQNQLMNDLQQLKIALATADQGIDQAILAEIYQPIEFDTIAVEMEDGTTARSEEEIGVARGLVYVMLFILYFAVIQYGNIIAMDIATEKSSRVMEILISSSPPISQMFAKILGIALLGLTQIGLFVGAGYYIVESRQEDFVGGFFEHFGFAATSIS